MSYCFGQFSGGDKDGGEAAILNQVNCPSLALPGIFLGGNEDGWAQASMIQVNCLTVAEPGIYHGGIEDGSSYSILDQIVCADPVYPSMFTGGQEDGSSYTQLTQVICSDPVYPSGIFAGGIEDGYASVVPLLPNCAPIADFTGFPEGICEGDSVMFTDNSTGGVDSWSWSFPGGTPSSSTLQNPVVSYPASGMYDVTLTVSNGYGSATLTKTTYISVGDATITNITADGPITFCQGDSVLLTAEPGFSYLWSPGGETTQSITVRDSGDYSVTVDGCKTPLAPTSVTVYPSPSPTITLGDFIGNEIDLTASGATSYLWSPGGETTQTITVIASGTVNYTLTVTDTNGCTGTVDALVIQSEDCMAAIPQYKVGLCSFSASPLDGKWVQVNWETPFEFEVAHYQVQFSSDTLSGSFETAGKVEVSGNYTQKQGYSFIHKQPLRGLSYYRLRQVGTDGRVKYSDPAPVQLFTSRISLVSLYPNPANYQITLKVINEYPGVIMLMEITDALSRNLMSERISPVTGQGAYEADISSLSPGLYFVRLTFFQENGQQPIQVITEKFVRH